MSAQTRVHRHGCTDTVAHVQCAEPVHRHERVDTGGCTDTVPIVCTDVRYQILIANSNELALWKSFIRSVNIDINIKYIVISIY